MKRAIYAAARALGPTLAAILLAAIILEVMG